MKYTKWLLCMFVLFLLGFTGIRVTTLEVLPTGLGVGRIVSTPPGIDCWSGVVVKKKSPTCRFTFPRGTRVELRVVGKAKKPVFPTWLPPIDQNLQLPLETSPASTFSRWEGDCSGNGTCRLTMDRFRKVRAYFDKPLPTLESSQLTNNTSPNRLHSFLQANPSVNTAAKFLGVLKSLPQKFTENWIFMTHSESLQTGTASSPRILLPSEDSTQVFSFSLEAHDAFPLSSPDVVEWMQWDQVNQKFRFHEIDLTQRRVSIDDHKCAKCHSGRPNWDAYDSWGGMLPFNRDRIYQGSVEAAAMRQLHVPWGKNRSVRQILEQLKLPAGITRLQGGILDGLIQYQYETAAGDLTLYEPELSSLGLDGPIDVNYPVPGISTQVYQNGKRFVLKNSSPSGGDQGRGVDLFDNLSTLNAKRIAIELVQHRRSPVDIRPIALAILKGLDVHSRLGFLSRVVLNRYNGKSLAQLEADTATRRESLPQRKFDLQKKNLDGSAGLLATYGTWTEHDGSHDIEQIRQELFRRPAADSSATPDKITGLIPDREKYNNNSKIAQFRYFLEPLGIPVDKWSMSGRGRSRTYTFADVFGKYQTELVNRLKASLGDKSNEWLLQESARQLNWLNLIQLARPAYADVQKIFDRNCTDCHGGLQKNGRKHGPYTGSLNLSKGVSYDNLRSAGLISTSGGEAGVSLSPLFSYINPGTSGNAYMPKGGPPLSPANIQTIKRWLNAGAHE